MPCNSDHLEPNQWEREAAKIGALLKETKKGKLPDWYNNPIRSKYYNQSSQTKARLDKMTSKLCLACQVIENAGEMSNHSLELQMWWRDHKKADAERVKKQLEEDSKESDRQTALSKLSDYEKELLGLK